MGVAGSFPSAEEAVAFIEKAWLEQTQRARIQSDRHHLYQDWSSDPQSLAVEAVGRGNLLSLVLEGYNGPSSEKMAKAVRTEPMPPCFYRHPMYRLQPMEGRTITSSTTCCIFWALGLWHTPPKKKGKSYLLGNVIDNTYNGSHAADGEGEALDLNGDGVFDMEIDLPCKFMVKHESGKIRAIETDRAVNATVLGKQYYLSAYVPIWLE